jgi:hypothetical protein
MCGVGRSTAPHMCIVILLFLLFVHPFLFISFDTCKSADFPVYLPVGFSILACNVEGRFYSSMHWRFFC